MKLKSDLEVIRPALQKENKEHVIIHEIRKIRQFNKDFERFQKSRTVRVLMQSLFISLFAAFDKFIGDLVSGIYKNNPDLYKSINREIQLSELLRHNDIESIKEAILHKEIETLRRKSYIEQFSELEKKFSLPLTKFEKWPNFIEFSQRRNLYTHCDGIISQQYIDVCESVNFKFSNKPVIGEYLTISIKHFRDACNIVSHVAVMLGQTLWRKTAPTEIKTIDANLNNIIYSYLNDENFNKAIELCKFAQNLPKISGDIYTRMMAINYAIALKFSGEQKAAVSVINKLDWTTVSYDFQLSYAVLNDNFTEASSIMRKIGTQSDLVREMSYHEWPLFKEFRESSEFLASYKEVYGYDYLEKPNEMSTEIQINESEIQ